MKKTVILIMGALMLLCGTSCARDKKVKTNQTEEKRMITEGKKVLVAFYSRTGENYGVGNIEKGNTHIIAEMIASETAGTLFEIVPEKAYPVTYDECVELAKKEKEIGARPAVKTDIKVEDYDIVFLGYPNWWGDMPMVVYTFIEKHDWKGKTVIPFCTNEGSGMSDTERYIAESCKGATVKKGLDMRGVTAQKKRDEAKKAVAEWLKNL